MKFFLNHKDVLVFPTIDGLGTGFNLRDSVYIWKGSKQARLDD